MSSKPTMLAVSLFESSEIALQSISAVRNGGIIDVAKHIRQGTEEHAASAFEITKDPALLWTASDLSSVLRFPVADLCEELIPVFVGMDRQDFEKQGSEVLGVGAFGLEAAPH